MDKEFKKKIILAVFIFLAFSVFPVFAQAASLYFSPSYGFHTIGSTFSVGVYVSSPDQSMNAASGVISFPQDKLKVVSFSKTGSIFTLWVQEPSFSNEKGTINFEGIVLNPGFKGSSGKIININFKVKAAGTANLYFSSGSVLANDGQGTNILTNLGKASFDLGSEKQVAPESSTPSEVVGVPMAPRVSSLTHPDPNKWYSTNKVKFTWPVPSDITAVRLLVGKIPQAVPTVYYPYAIQSKEISNLEDGVWYFHVRLKNSAGWGGISHFRFKIDTKKPSHFEISEVRRDDKTNPKVKFIFDAKDETSGIDHYEVQIDDGNFQVWKDDGSRIFETPALSPGKHILIAKAVDKAGNSLANSVEFNIEPLDPPIITSYPEELTSDDHLIVKGSARPNSQVIIWIQNGVGNVQTSQNAQFVYSFRNDNNNNQSQIVKSDSNGNFTFVYGNKLKYGVYTLWAEVIDQRGARSKPSEKINIVVKQPEILKIAGQTTKVLAIIIPLVALIIILFVLIWYGWHKFILIRKKINKETKEAEKILHSAIKLLKDDVKEQIQLLEKTKSKRQLTEEEDKIIKQLKKDLDDVEKLVRKRIKDIQKVYK